MSKVLYENKTQIIQVIYNEEGEKREVIPGGTVELEKAHGDRLLNVLAPVQLAEKAPAKADKKSEDKGEDK